VRSSAGSIMMVWSDGSQLSGNGAHTELVESAPRRGSGAREGVDALVDRSRSRLIQPRLVVGLVLIAGGIVWALARGLEFFGLTPADVAYNLDQPPLLLAFVGAWLLYRSRRR
jgi:hypothetical protein